MFGPADVGLWRMALALALEAGEPNRAVSIAGSVSPMQLPFASRQAPRTTPITATDRRCHRITDDAYTAGLVAGSGRYIALCGRSVASTAIVCPSGPDCRSCAAAAGSACLG